MIGKEMSKYRDKSLRYNASGYIDKTAEAAIKSAYKAQIAQKKRELIADILELADNAGFKITSTIRLAVKEEADR